MFEANMFTSWRWSFSFSDRNNCDQLQRDDARVWIHENCIGCAAVNRVSSIVCATECVCLLVCLPVFVWKLVYAECENKPQERKRNTATPSKSSLPCYNNTKFCGNVQRIKIKKKPQQKSNQQLKNMLNLFIILANRDSHWSRREAARSWENLLFFSVFHLPHDAAIEAIRLIAWLIYFCTWFATHAPRRATWLALRFRGASIASIASSIPVGVKLSSACGTWRSWLTPSLSLYLSVSLSDSRGAAIMLICVPCDFIDRLTEPNRSTLLIRKKFAMQRMKIDLMIAPAWSTTFSLSLSLWSDRIATRPQIL